MTDQPCPDCGHATRVHSFVGCLDDSDCDCTRTFPNANATVEQARAEAAEAMERVERGTDPEWEAAAESAVRGLADLKASFTPDDVWEYLERIGVPPPREPRALGPILKRLANADVIRPKGFTESRRRHGAPVRIYKGGEE